MHVAAVAWHGSGGPVLLVRDHMFYETVSLLNALSKSEEYLRWSDVVRGTIAIGSAEQHPRCKSIFYIHMVHTSHLHHIFVSCQLCGGLIRG